MGNSIVRAGQSTPGTVDTAKSEKSVQAGQTAYNQAKAAGQSDAQAQRAAITATVEAAGGAVDLTGEASSGLIAEQNFNPDDGFRISNGTDSAFINYGDASNLDFTLSAVGNFLSTAPAADLAFNFAAGQIIGKHNRDAAFSAGVARGEASYINGINNRASVGVDVRPLAIAQARYRNQGVRVIDF